MIALDWSPVQRRKAEIIARKKRAQEKAREEAKRCAAARRRQEQARARLTPSGVTEALVLARQNQDRDYGDDIPTTPDPALSGAQVGFAPEISRVPDWLAEFRRTRPVEIRRPSPPEDLMAYKRPRRVPHGKVTKPRFALS